MDESQKVLRTAAAVLILLVAAAGVYYLFLADRGLPSDSPDKPVAEAVRPESPAAGQPPEAGAVTAPLDQSDTPLRGMAGDLSSNPVFLRWIESKDLIRRFVAGVDAVANGQSPRPQADFFALKEDFSAVTRGGRVYLNPSSYARYDVVADVLDSVSVEGAAKLYRDFQSQIRQAYRDLGYPRGDFHRTLLKAFNELLATPVVEGPIELERRVKTYVCLDPRLEDLSAPQKHLLRMGPENVQLIQAKLRELAPALGFAETELVKPVRIGPNGGA